MYLDEYGQGDIRRERFFKTLVALLLIAIALGLIYYVFFRNWVEERQARLFLSALDERRYEQAYEYWGCSINEPCRFYSYEKFLIDWGPESELGVVKSFRLGRSYNQKTGVIVEITVNGETRENLWVERETKYVSFFPY